MIKEKNRYRNKFGKKIDRDDEQIRRSRIKRRNPNEMKINKKNESEKEAILKGVKNFSFCF